MKNIEKIIGIGMLLFAIGFNLWLYRMEPTTKIDPNDNTFQFSLVDRTNQIWNFAQQNCSGITRPFCVVSFLTDHWVPNWAEGYNLPYYYSHIPQITIVASYRLLSQFLISISQFSLKMINLKLEISLFQYYHWLIYLLLSLFPLSLFLALRVIGLSWITAGIGALIASQLSTDGLYGLDPASFLWRGYGLSSQLFAVIWLPLAVAFSYRMVRSNQVTNIRSYVPAILTLAATTAGHLGIGIIAFISVGVMAVGSYLQTILTNTWNQETWKKLTVTFRTLVIMFGGVGLLLGYWILPILIGGNYHNISVWDGIWKFDSFGYREVLKNLLNGDLFDFGRLPILTTLVFVGLFSSLSFRPLSRNPAFEVAKWTPDQVRGNIPQHISFGILFLFWLLLYFGRTTWGGLFNLIPGMDEFHLSRFIVGVHMAGLFLIPLGIEWIVTTIFFLHFFRSFRQFITLSLGYFVIIVILVALVTPQTRRYASYNDTLIKQANENYTRDEADISALLSAIRQKLSAHPGRVYAGRGGSWGKDFRIAETPMYMHLSTYGIPVILWLPETWSPNSDTEQYFSENNPAHYSLYNVRYVVTPTNLPNGKLVEPQPFWRLTESGKTWRLYSVVIPASEPGSSEKNAWIPDQVRNDKNNGYITSGIRPAIVSSNKEDYRNVVRLWMHSPTLSQGLYPELTFDKRYPKNTGLPNFRMLDEVTYRVPDGSTRSLFAEMPRYESPAPNISIPTITSQSETNNMRFQATVEVKNGCMECVVVLKQTYHPSWTATIDGKPVKPFAVFPFYTAISIDDAGTHEVVFSYEPSTLKKILLFILFVTIGDLIWLARPNALKKFKARP